MKILILIVLLTFLESKAFVLQNPYWFMEQSSFQKEKSSFQEQSQADEEQAKELKCSENGHWSNGDVRNLWLAFLCHMNQESDIRIQRISFF